MTHGRRRSGATAGLGVLAGLLLALLAASDQAAGLDAIPPNTTILSRPAPDTVNPYPGFTFSASEPGSTFECRLDTASFTPCGSPKGYAALADGAHTFRVRATDAAGNTEPIPAVARFTLRSNVPNILLIITDDQPAAALTMQEMPNASQIFGAGGTQYTQAYDTTPICCPSRASIFTGKYAHNHGITINDGTGFNETQSQDTWQRYLHDAGYFTGLLGKYLNQVPTGAAPYFDVRKMWEFSDTEEVRKIETESENFLAQAEKRDRQPWALVYSTYEPHEPFDTQPLNPQPIEGWTPPPSYGETNLSDKHPVIREEGSRFDPATAEANRTGQLTELQAADESIGKLFTKLSALNERQSTLAIFISDNGFFWGQHGLDSGKQWPYLEATRVPFFISWPGHVAPGASSSQIVANIDIAPTLFDVTGIQPGYTVDGRSIFSAPARPWLLLESPTGDARHPAWSAYVTPTREYIEWEDGTGFVEDYDLPTDPWELRASNQPDAAIAADLAAARACVGIVCP